MFETASDCRQASSEKVANSAWEFEASPAQADFYFHSVAGSTADDVEAQNLSNQMLGEVILSISFGCTFASSTQKSDSFLFEKSVYPPQTWL